MSMLKRNKTEIPVKFKSDHPLGSIMGMDDIFADFFRDWPSMTRWARMPGAGTEGQAFNPKVNVRESDTEIAVSAELPGLAQDDIDIDLAEDHLTIKGEKRFEKEEGDPEKDHYYVERSYGAFQRTIPLRASIDLERASATYRDGVLDVRIPKTQEERARKRKLDIR